MSTPQEKEIENLIRARYPLIQMISWEEERAERYLKQVSERLGKQFHTWSAAQGLVGSGNVLDPATRDPKLALERLPSLGTQSLFLFRDLHPYFADPVVVRRLRELSQEFKCGHRTILLISPTLNVPLELEKEMTVVDYDLPDAEELKRVLADVISAGQGNARFGVNLSADDQDRLIQGALGLTVTEMENVLAKAIVTGGTLDISALDIIFQETRQIIRKSRVLEYFETKENFSQVGGLDQVKEWLKKRGDSFTKKARDFGLPSPRGVLILGVQGCGKSLACKAVSGLWKMPLLRLDMGALFGGFVGQSEENMRRALKTAESVAPCVLWLDEIEKGLAGTQSSPVSDAGTTARVFSTFLTWLQEKSKPVFVAATANNIHSLPPELLRRGRFDEIFFVDLPSLKERGDILEIQLKRKNRDPRLYDISIAARAMVGFSGAEIEQVVVASLHEAFAAGRDLESGDILRSVQDLIPLSRTMSEEIDALRSWAANRARPASRSSDENASV
jgi:ATP-dependent 26S proteasome regulatory subunit